MTHNRWPSADHPYIEPIHILKAMADPAASPTRALLRAAGAAVEPLQASVDQALSDIKAVSGVADVHISQDTQRLLNHADKSQQAGDAFLSTDSVLLAMLESKTTASLFKDAGLTTERYRAPLIPRGA